MEVDTLGKKLTDYDPYRVEKWLLDQHNSLRVQKVCFLCNWIVKQCFSKWDFEIKLFWASEMIEVIDNIFVLPINLKSKKTPCIWT